jgi:hypothetical protein
VMELRQQARMRSNVARIKVPGSFFILLTKGGEERG